MKKRSIIISLIICCLAMSCGPGHHLAFKQFESPYSGGLLSVQGYVVKGSDGEQLSKDWNRLLVDMSKQPGFISGFLSSGVGESNLWLAHSEWRSLEDLRNAFANPKILELEAKLPKKQFEHLFELGSEAKYFNSKN
ncbi:MAG: antibiotic biosynthesis monooxygenase [bacterium]|nr:antibiotic biosynthesis monooxygenase [bacterium]